MNYSTNKVQVSYFVELPRSNFTDYANTPTLAKFPDISRNSRKVVTVKLRLKTKYDRNCYQTIRLPGTEKNTNAHQLQLAHLQRCRKSVNFSYCRTVECDPGKLLASTPVPLSPSSKFDRSISWVANRHTMQHPGPIVHGPAASTGVWIQC